MATQTSVFGDPERPGATMESANGDRTPDRLSLDNLPFFKNRPSSRTIDKELDNSLFIVSKKFNLCRI
jgi:hypothetical protein